MKTSTQVNISDVVDGSRIGNLQIVTFILCGLCMIMDGFDVQSMGYVAPAVTQEWQIPSAQLGRVFGAGNFGMLIGSVLLTILADKTGRRPVLIGAALFLAAVMFLTAQARSVEELFALRLIGGVAMGSIVPNATALIGEYAPRRKRVTLLITIAVGFTAGAAIGGFIAAWLIPNFGWRSVFYFGGAVPLVVGILMIFWLPESLQFMVLGGKSLEKVGRWLRRIDPTVPVNSTYVVQEENRGGVPVGHLFRQGRTIGTVLLWIINFMNLLNLYFLANWLATVVRDAGYPTSTAVLVSTTLQVGGTLGTFGLAAFIGRLGFIPVLTTGFAVASVSIALIGQPGLSLDLLFVVVFIAGWCIVGAQPAINAFAATYYPTYLRSTGIGWALGIGRVGAIIGPVLAGELIGLQWSVNELFLAAAIPAVLASIVTFSLRWATRIKGTYP